MDFNEQNILFSYFPYKTFRRLIVVMTLIEVQTKHVFIFLRLFTLKSLLWVSVSRQLKLGMGFPLRRTVIKKTMKANIRRHNNVV